MALSASLLPAESAPNHPSPEQSILDALGTNRVITEVRIAGRPAAAPAGSGLVLTARGREYVARRFEFTSLLGTDGVIEAAFRLGSDNRSLDWRVHRGAFLLEHPDAGCWRVLSGAGQNLRLAWRLNPTILRIAHQVEPQFSSTEAGAVVFLGNGIAARVSAAAEFSFGSADRCRDLRVLATNAPVDLFSSLPPGAQGISELAVLGSYPVSWQVRVAAGNVAALALNPSKGIIDLSAPAPNHESLELVLDDGAVARVPASARLRFDAFRDGTYCLSGTGGTSGLSVDGEKWEGHRGHLAGGPLVTISSPQGSAGFARRNPVTMILIEPPAPGESRLTLNVGGERLILEVGQPKAVHFTNGSAAQLVFEKETTLRWAIGKGNFQFRIAGLEHCRINALSEQTGALTWDTTTRAMDISNTSALGPLLVSLPNRTIASVGPRATLQFAQVNSASFATSAHGGAVSLYNTATGQETRLEQSNLLVRWGTVVRPADTKAPKNSARLDWQSGSDLQLNGPGAPLRVAPGKSLVLESPNGGRLEIIYGTGTDVLLRALVGDYTLALQPIQDMTVELLEGDAVVLQLDTRRGIFLARADDANERAVLMRMPDGLQLPVFAAQSITLTGKVVSHTALASGTMVFYESAGAGDVAPYGLAPVNNPLPSPFTGTLPVGNNNRYLDVTIISQPAVSVIR